MNQYSKVNTSCLLILTFIAMAFTLSITKSILIPFTMAIFITFIYSPFIQYFHEKFKLPKNLVLGISLILFILGISLMAILLSKSIQTFLQGADQYKDRLSEVSIQVTQTLQNFGFGFSQNEVKELFQKVPLGKFIKDISGGLVGGISNSFLVIIFSLFLLTGDSMSKQKNKTYEEIKKNTRKYIQTKLMTSAATAIISYVILVSFGVEMAFMFAFLTFLLNFIPTVGSIVAVIIPLPIILLQFGFGVK
ncbi:MAG: AI-2E family transporter, partial [Halobacteriovoraceae bacterium]|nr:AI-2E family transporter [Halobacteriovoraceae bacterium]